jgi:hypothetical protein
MKVKTPATFPVMEGFSSNNLTLIYSSFYESHQPTHSRSCSAIIAINPGFSSAAAIGRKIFGHT